MKKIETIANAGNTEVPCHLAIDSLGYKFSRSHEKTDQELWIAENEEIRFVAANQLELLGLIYMRTIRGKNRKANDKKIDTYLATYYPESL